MAAETVDTDLREKLNSHLKGASPGSYYKHVRVSLLFWDGDSENGRKFQNEGRCLGDLFGRFGFEVDEFKIPLELSQLSLETYILKEVEAASRRMVEGTGKSLLILHYGGHGSDVDRDGRAVWAPEPIPGAVQPLVTWYAIQDQLEKSEADILLMLDCCFGASAGRAGTKVGRIELISATAKREKTPPPGPWSFTNAVIKVLGETLANDYMTDREDVTAETLHRRLLHMEAKLPATASHVVLRAGIPGRSIRIRPLYFEQDMQQPDVKGPLIRLLIRTSSLDRSKINELAIWLRSDIPSDVALEVESITDTIGSLQSLITSLPNTNEPVGRALSEDSLSRIVSAWNDICELVEQYRRSRQQVPRTQSLFSILESQARKFLTRLEEENSYLIESVEQGILNSSYVESESGIDSLLKTPEMETLGIADQLRLLQFILCSGGDNVDEQEHSTKLQAPRHGMGHIWKEEKIYKQSLEREDVLQIEQRIRRIAKLMEAAKSKKFHALECISWFHDDGQHKFILEFQIPPTHNPTCWSLKDILGAGTKKRPTLGQRFYVAYAIAEAVLHWHSVQWVHQSITSYNIIFFEDKQSKIDYANCFLQQFDYARPKQEPSIGRYVDDIQYNVYRHPDRQGPSRQGHTKLHDIYSLGVVLLEIGLWEDVCITSGVKKIKDLTVTQMVHNLHDAAKKRLPHYMGRDYQEAVLACLNSECDPELDDKAQSHLAELFQKLVMDKLRKNRDLR
ncbi:hypothetical protein K449DRAFT_454634 [Hypoxylon sp. EC38]|nr:hypothetical protein K449DRAFT_454634 [Hypoxylon sp. EC38]